MRYSGTALRLAQSSLTAPFCCQRLVSVPHKTVIQSPTKLSGFSRLGKTAAVGVESRTLRRELERRWTRRGCLGNVKGGLRGGIAALPRWVTAGAAPGGCACWALGGGKAVAFEVASPLKIPKRLRDVRGCPSCTTCEKDRYGVDS
jgi:hypothetical protein